MPASTQVLETYELVELTLLHPPLINLLRAQCVSKVWYSVAKRSQKIQQATFMRSSSDTRLVCEVDGNLKYSIRVREQWMRCPLSRSAVECTPLLNPVLLDFISRNKSSGVTNIKHYGFIVPTQDNGLPGQVDEQTVAQHTPDVSWKGMLVAQPSVTNIALFCSQKCLKDAKPTRTFHVEDQAGVRFRRLVDAIRKHWFICPNCPLIFADDNEPETAHWETRRKLSLEQISVNMSGWELLERLKASTSKSSQIEA